MAPGRGAQAVAWLTLLLLVSGASRLLVVCAGPHPEPRVELTHASGHCGCTHDDGAGTARSGHRSEDALAHDGEAPPDTANDPHALAFGADHTCCVDRELRLVPWNRPRSPAAGSGPPSPEPAALPVAAPRLPEGSVRSPLGPGPSPPRAPGRIQLERSVVLLI